MATTAHRRAAVAENMAASMPSCTAQITSTFVVHACDMRPPADRRRRYPQRAGFSTAAGFARRPWFERLHRALERDLFVLHYQPIVSLQPGRIGGQASHYEALIRLADEPGYLLADEPGYLLADEPGGRLIAPGEFLPAAERYGLIGEIDRLVLARVIALLGGELADGRERIAVNLSALSITDRGMLPYIEAQLARHRVDPARLIVELTETAAISDMALAQAFCEGLQRLGSAVALDDFGAGFGSLQYLKQLSFTYLKIDGGFIRALPSSRKDQLLVRALADLARSMGKHTIAEYVGDGPTVQLLRDYGVDYAQGFQLGRPVCPIEAFAAA